MNGDGAGLDTGGIAESASAFVRRFQAARNGRPGAMAGLVRPGASVLLNGRALEFDAAETPEEPGDGSDAAADDGADGATVVDGVDAWEILTEAPPRGGANLQITDSAVFEGSALYVIGYDGASETVVLDRDATGWGVQLLHRVAIDGDGTGDP